jgi:hypothetical protein
MLPSQLMGQKALLCGSDRSTKRNKRPAASWHLPYRWQTALENGAFCCHWVTVIIFLTNTATCMALGRLPKASRQVEFTMAFVLTLLFRFWTNIVIFRDAVQTGLSVQTLHLYFVCLCYNYLLMADLDSRNMLQFTIKHYCTGSVCCVWSDN